MKVLKSKDLGHGHSIEIGKSTWDKKQKSIRNRYTTSKGKFNLRSSSEIPITDMKEIITMMSKGDLLEPKILAEMINDISASIIRQS